MKYLPTFTIDNLLSNINKIKFYNTYILEIFFFQPKWCHIIESVEILIYCWVTSCGVEGIGLIKLFASPFSSTTIAGLYSKNLAMKYLEI